MSDFSLPWDQNSNVISRVQCSVTTFMLIRPLADLPRYRSSTLSRISRGVSFDRSSQAPAGPAIQSASTPPSTIETQVRMESLLSLISTLDRVVRKRAGEPLEEVGWPFGRPGV